MTRDREGAVERTGGEGIRKARGSKDEGSVGGGARPWQSPYYVSVTKN